MSKEEKPDFLPKHLQDRPKKKGGKVTNTSRVTVKEIPKEEMPQVREKLPEDPAPEPTPAAPKLGGSQPFNRWALVLGVCVVVLLASFVAKPTILGYGIYQQVAETGLEEYAKDVKDVGKELVATKTNLSTYSEVNERLISEIAQVNDQLARCEIDKGTALNDIAESQKQVSAMRVELQEAKDELADEIDKEVAKRTDELADERAECESNLLEVDETVKELQADFDDFADSVAHSVCCKEKVDNGAINSYSTTDNVLRCLETGGTPLDC